MQGERPSSTLRGGPPPCPPTALLPCGPGLDTVGLDIWDGLRPPDTDATRRDLELCGARGRRGGGELALTLREYVTRRWLPVPQERQLDGVPVADVHFLA